MGVFILYLDNNKGNVFHSSSSREYSQTPQFFASLSQLARHFDLVYDSRILRIPTRSATALMPFCIIFSGFVHQERYVLGMVVIVLCQNIKNHAVEYVLVGLASIMLHIWLIIRIITITKVVIIIFSCHKTHFYDD